MIESQMCYPKQYATVLGKKMAYVDTADKNQAGNHAIVFCHGNITSSYLWRNVIPHLDSHTRCIAIDNIGQGDSDKLDPSGPSSYRLAEHQKYFDALLEQFNLGQVTLMMHDWGVQLGLTWARLHQEKIKGLAYIQGLMGNMTWDYWTEEVADLMRKFRSQEGEKLVLEDNFFVEKILPAMVIRDLPGEVHDEYRRPYRNPGEDRRPTLTWPREIPVEGEPADVLAVIDANNAWMKSSSIPKLFFHCEPETVLKGHILDMVRTFPKQTEVTVKGLHYVQEDSPHEIGEALADWYQKLEQL
ncbi:haloalkane dehalogenase [Pseudomonadota bacterium]